MIEVYQRKDGRYVPAIYQPNKKRFRAVLTVNGQPNEACSVDDLKYTRSYGSIESLSRALRKKKNGELT